MANTRTIWFYTCVYAVVTKDHRTFQFTFKIRFVVPSDTIDKIGKLCILSDLKHRGTCGRVSCIVFHYYLVQAISKRMLQGANEMLHYTCRVHNTNCLSFVCLSSHPIRQLGISVRHIHLLTWAPRVTKTLRCMLDLTQKGSL